MFSASCHPPCLDSSGGLNRGGSDCRGLDWFETENSLRGTTLKNVSIEILGYQPFAAVRLMQDDLVRRRIKGEAKDTLLFCEHPPTLSHGMSSDRATEEQELECSRLGVEIVYCDRGGLQTYHGPGQLIVYPVISLRERGVGVRRFVELGLVAISRAVEKVSGVRTQVELAPAGLWVGEPSSRREFPGRKIASVGIRLQRGVTSHGFSLNCLGGDRKPRYFTPCGLAGVQLTSLIRERNDAQFSLAELIVEISREFADSLGKGREG